MVSIVAIEMNICREKCLEYLDRLKIKYCIPPLFLMIFILKLLLKEPMHGYQITERLNEILNVNVQRQVIYFVLRKQEDAGLVKSMWTYKQESKPRKIYSITESGKEFLHYIVPYLKSLLDMVEYL